METWLAVFIVVAAVAIVIQTLLLLGCYLVFRRTSATLIQTVTNLDSRLSPMLIRIDKMLEDSHRQVAEIVKDTAEIVHTVKNTGQRFDRLLDEAADRLRLQIIQADRMLTGAMEAVEDAGAQLKESVVEPVRTAAALLKGVRAGVEFFRGRRHMPNRAREAQDEELFI